jgi:hypothetical protein
MLLLTEVAGRACISKKGDIQHRMETEVRFHRRLKGRNGIRIASALLMTTMAVYGTTQIANFHSFIPWTTGQNCPAWGVGHGINNR